MSIKIVYVAVDLCAVVGLFLTLGAIRKMTESHAKWLSLTLHFGIIAICSNIAIALSFDTLFANVAYCLYFAAIDWILFFLSGFCLLYTEHENILKKIMLPAAIIMSADTMAVMTNPMLEKHFSIIKAKSSDGTLFFLTSFRSFYYVHLAVAYTAAAAILVFMFIRIIKSRSIYRLRYVIIFSIFLLIIILNSAYIALELPLDISVIFYAAAGILIYFSITKLVPWTLRLAAINSATEDMSEGLILFDINGKCIYANRFATDRFKVDVSRYSPKDEPIHTALEKLKNAGKTFGETDYSINYGTEKEPIMEHYRLKYNKLSDNSEKIIGSYLLIDDVTEEVDLLQELRRSKENSDSANNAKSAFLASMSHEIRTPLNSVLGMNELISRYSDDPVLKDYSESIKTSGETLLALINDILDFSKIEAGKMDIIETEYDPYTLLRECYHFFEHAAQAKDLYINIQSDESMPSVLIGDTKHINQVLSNIVSNAIKYTKEGGITIGMSAVPTSNDSADLILEVSDTGVGIDKADIKYLFDPFRRINEKQNANIQGTGLGLSITNELVSLMNGNITVDSIRGRGSMFRIVIPQKIKDVTPIGAFELITHEEIKKYKEKFRAPGTRILVVDDVPMNLKVVSGLLRPTFIRIDKASSGDEAIEKCKETKYDVILLDHRMPQKDGVETFREIRAFGRNTETPVIMLTANALRGAEEEYKSLGFAGYISKPVVSEDLEAALMKFLPENKIEILEDEPDDDI